MTWLSSNIYAKHDGCNCNRVVTQVSRFKMFFFFYLKSSSAVAMSLQQKFKLPILERTTVCYSCNLQKETYSRRKENQFRAPDMHMPVIEINVHNITMYQKQRLFSHICKCLQKLIMWSIQKVSKKVSIRLFLFLMKVAGQVPCWFHE